MRWWLVVVFAIAACPRPRSEPAVVPPAIAETIPTLAITSPDRGAFVGTSKLAVTGRVTGDGVRVTVNGRDATVADGSFSAEIPLEAGLSIVETHAIGKAGHDVRDVRAVLVGPFATSDGSTRAAVGAHLGRTGLDALATALQKSAKAIDWSAATTAINPVYEVGGCFGIKVDIASLTIGAMEVRLAPTAGAIAVTWKVDDIVVKANVRYEVACIGKTTTVSLRTRAVGVGELRPVLSGNRISTSLATRVRLDDLQLDLGSIPRPIAWALKVGIHGGVERAINTALERKVSPIIDAKLAELLARPLVQPLLGREVKIEIVPTKLAITHEGLAVGADVGLVVMGGERGRYVRPAVQGLDRKTSGASVWMSVDAINQLFAGLWAARALERTISLDDVGPMKLLLDSSVKTIEMAIALPPTVTARAEIELAIGDLSITMRDAAGAELQKFAVSLRSKLAFKKDELVLTTGEPVVYAQLLAQSTTLGRPLDQTAVEGIVKGAWTLIDGMLVDALSRVPISAIGGLEIRGLSVGHGTILVDVAAKPR